MLRLFRSRPSILRFGAFSKAQARTEPQTIRLQRVKIRPRLYKPMALATAAITYATAWLIYSHLTGSVIDDFLANEMANMSLDERKRLRKKLDQVEPFYIPLPGTCKLVRPEPYKKTDPEWKAFIRMAQDPQLVNSLRDELAEIVLAKFIRQTTFGQKHGRNWRIRAHWLDVAYPHEPPPTYEQKALSWEPEGLTLATKPINSLAANRLSHILWPSALGLSTWTFAKELCKQNLRSTAKFFGFDLKPRGPVDDFANNRVNWAPPGSGPGAASGKSQPLAKSQPKARGSGDQNVPASSGTQAANVPESTSEAPTMSPRSTPSSSSTTSPSASGPDTETTRLTKVQDIYGVREMSEHTSGPREAMVRAFMRIFRPARPMPPRGSVYFSGLVNFVSPDSTVTFDVRAYWDPAEKKWWPIIDMQTKHVRKRTFVEPPER